MLINSKGETKTIIQHNNHRDVNEMKWDAKYDGAIANVSLNVNNNGKNTHKEFQLTNENLANIFTVPSVDASLDERLLKDFQIGDSSNKEFKVIRYPIRVLRRKTKRKRSKPKNKYTKTLR
jgi:hypothetical protein